MSQHHNHIELLVNEYDILSNILDRGLLDVYSISNMLEKYPLDRLSYVDRNLIRIGTYELMFTETPKAIIINDEKYLENTAIIDKKEYIELSTKFYFIFQKFERFVYKYIDVIKKFSKDSYEYKRMKFCTLQYFHTELGIEKN